MTQEDDTWECSRRCSRAISYWFEDGGPGVDSVQAAETPRLDWQTDIAIYFRFLVFLLVPFVRASLL
jgi:hypothetical protein